MNYTSLRSSLALVLLTSCAALRGPFVCPEHGGASWSEVTSAHFVLKTDLGTSDAQAASAKLEETFAALSDLGFASSDKPKNRVDVVYFRSRDAYFEFAPRSTSAQFIPFGRNDFERRPTALLGGAFDDAARANVQHELTHLFVRYYYPQAPVWLNEGLARYLETLSMEGGTTTLGRAPANARFWSGPWRRGRDGALLMPMSVAVSPSRLRAMTAEEFYAKQGLDLHMPEGLDALKAQTAHYQAAWCLVHVLMTNQAYADDFHHYLDRLRAGEPESSAWDKTLDDELDSIEADYKAALAPPEVMTLHIAYTPPESHPERVRAMTDTEVHVLWARLRKWESPEARSGVEADLAEARRAPDDPDLAMADALWAIHNGQRARGEEILRSAVAAHPDEPRLWNALGWSAIDDADRGGAPASELVPKLAPIAAKLAPIAKSAAQLDLLAHASLLDGKPDAAIGYEKAAVAVDPNCVDCLGWAARAMLEKGLSREALEVATLAQGISPDGARPPWIARLVQRARGLSGFSGAAAGCVPLRGPLSALTSLVAEIHKARQKGDKISFPPAYGAGLTAYLRSLPTAASSAGEEGRASMLAYLTRVVGELPDVPTEALSHDEEEGLALLEKVPTACHMSSLKNGRLDRSAVNWDPEHRPDFLNQCWNEALRRDPSHGAGGVPMEVLIERDGSVSFAHSFGSTIPDAAFVACLEDGFLGMSYPKPEDGVVRVHYPLHFAPGGEPQRTGSLTLRPEPQAPEEAPKSSPATKQRRP